MSTRDELKKIVTVARPLIEQAADLGEELAAVRDAATEKGIDWSQLKSLLKASVLDEREGCSKRVDRLLEKADFATAYADMLGFGKMNENKNTRSSAASSTKLTIVAGGQTVETDSATLQRAADFAQTTAGRRKIKELASNPPGLLAASPVGEPPRPVSSDKPAGGAATDDDDDGGIPKFLRREPAKADA